MIDYQVRLDVPIRTRAAVCINEDDSFTIFINPALSVYEQRRAFLHEMRHILNDDFYKSDVNLIESEAHRYD